MAPDASEATRSPAAEFGIVFVDLGDERLVVTRPDGSVLLDQAIGATTLPMMSISHDQRTLAYWRTLGEPFKPPHELVSIDFATGQSRSLFKTETERPWGSPAWSSAGDLIAFATSTAEPPDPPAEAKLWTIGRMGGEGRVLWQGKDVYPIIPRSIDDEGIGATQSVAEKTQWVELRLDGTIANNSPAADFRNIVADPGTRSLVGIIDEHEESGPATVRQWLPKSYGRPLAEFSINGEQAVLRPVTKELVFDEFVGAGSELKSRADSGATRVLMRLDSPSLPVAFTLDGRWLLIGQLAAPGRSIVDMEALAQGAMPVPTPPGRLGALAIGLAALR